VSRRRRHPRPGSCMYNACMNVQVRDLPDDVHEVLVARAARAGQSLQQYLSAQLAAIASMPTLDEVIDRLDQPASGSLTTRDAIEALEAERARR